MPKATTVEKPKTAQPPARAEQSAPTPKTADQLLAEQLTIEAELEALPARVQQAKALASDSVDDKIITDALATAAELERKKTTLQIKRWHAKRTYLQAAREEALNPSPTLQDEMVKAREELSQAEKAVKEAIAARDAAERKFKTLAGQLRGAAIRVQQLAGELQRHEQEKPQL